MEKLCILNQTCSFSNYYRILNSCKGKYHIVRSIRDADWCIFPYCSCTDSNIEAIEQELKNCLMYKKENCKVIVTGCIFYVKDSKRRFLEEYDIDYLVPADNQVERICEILGVEPSDSIYNHYEIIGSVKIAEGCLNKCSFCRVHYSNRQLKSLTMEVIENQVKDLVSKGIKYISLRALNTIQYGIDLTGKKMIHLLIRRLSQIEGLEGIQIKDASLSDLDDEIANEIYANKLVISIGIDMQSGSDSLLKTMNVGHDVQTIRKYFYLLKEKIHCTQIISGFPGETLEDVQKTIDLLKELQIPNVYVTEYSDSKDIPSGKMKQLSEEVAKEHKTRYDLAVKNIRENAIKQNEGKLYIGYISGISLTHLEVYCPKIGEVIVEQIEEEFSRSDNEKQGYQINLNDKVKIRYTNGKYSLVELIEPSLVETLELKEQEDELVDWLTNRVRITTDFGYTIGEIKEIFARMFYVYFNGKKHNFNEFESEISELPEIVKKAFREVYQSIHND